MPREGQLSRSSAALPLPRMELTETRSRDCNRLPIMSWALAEDWLAIVGLILLTYGTGAQAAASFADYKALWKKVKYQAKDAFTENLFTENLGTLAAAANIATQDTGQARPSFSWEAVWRRPAMWRRILTAAFTVPRKLPQLRDRNAPEAADLAKAVRSTAVWAVIMIGSALSLASGIILLVLA
jgi:hypothetical protein